MATDLVTVQDVVVSIGDLHLLDHINFQIQSGERIALIGRNGAGKSTLMKLLSGEQRADEGEIRKGQGVRVAHMRQEVPHGTDGDVWEVVTQGLGQLGEWLAEFHHLSHAEEFDMDAFAEVQAKIENANGWALDQRVTEVLQKLELDGDVPFNALSGGLKRRALLAQALVSQPDVLLLDEPTNHLDIESIDWLEGFLRSWQGALVFITHDRRFLRSLATRILELDRGQLTSWPGDWANYVRRREERANAEAQANARFDKLLAQEEVWIRQGIKARRTRDEGRVRRLKALREERAQRRNVQGNVKLETSNAQASGKKVIEAKALHFAYGDRVLIDNFSTVIMRGDRIGLIGANGSGKSTMLKLLLGELQPTRGEVLAGTQLQLAYFDQHRATLREDWTALENVAEGRESVEINGRQKHAIGYLQDFLFTPDRARAPISKLSGGERNRLLLAKLFAQPSNVLVMDEPTNDLDAETLELLESLLMDYPGTLIVVSHDRDFLDNVVTSTVVMEGEGRVNEYVGGYSDWERHRDSLTAAKPVPANTKAAEVPAVPVSAAPVATKRKLTFKEARELEELPKRIEALEESIARMSEAMNDPTYFQRDSQDIQADQTALANAQAELEAAYARWEALDS
ncbi:ATP-binding cassette domain-containing protein [Lysobacter soyae]|uniref:ATP-binding protein Uup n=1 Tax=Lysobacter soyae TaxID=2764185 RepID=A0ABX8WKU6_9GAMM|nr:ATP-binding cassette domain-containing protein [Lysobacter sp. CJ11]QYR52230.1 ATP-binding cassette domain-containing protein [Lysobacter sp. CJ11]